MTPGGPHRGGRGEPDDRGANRDALSHFFAGPTDDDRARLRADLLARAGQVRATGWEPYHGLWSTGEVIGVALLLGDHAELAALGETVQSALERWAFDLWGLDGGQADVDDGCEETRECGSWMRHTSSAARKRCANDPRNRRPKTSPCRSCSPQSLAMTLTLIPNGSASSPATMRCVNN